MKRLFFIFSLVIFGMIPSAYSAKNPIQEAAVQQYYQDQVVKQIEQFIPKGKFSVQVKAEIDFRKMGQENNAADLPVPMLGSIAPQEQSESNTTPMGIDELLHFVKKVEISVRLATGISTQAHEIISSTITNMVIFNSKRGDKISFGELPASISEIWSPFQQPFSAMKIPLALIAFSIIFGLALVSFMIVFGINKTAARLSGEVQTFTNDLKSVFEKNGMVSTQPSASGQSISQNISQVNVENVEGYQHHNQDFWEKLDPACVAAFMNDCWAQEQYKNIPFSLLNGLFDRTVAEEIEKLIHPSMLRVSENTATLSMSEIHQLYQKHHIEYRKILRSKLGKEFVNLTIEQLSDLKSKMTDPELILSLKNMTPIKRSAFIGLLSPNERIELAKVSKQVFSENDLKNSERSLLDKMSKTHDIQELQDRYEFGSLTEIIFKPAHFQDDEVLFQNASVETGYFSPLMCLETFKNEDWEEFSAQESAMVFWGYSENYRNKLVEKYAGKKGEWIRSFLSKFEQTKPNFNSAMVESIRAKFKQKFFANHLGDQSDQQKAS